MAVIFRKDFKVKMWALICYWHFKMGQVMSHFMWAFQDQNQEELEETRGSRRIP